MSEVAPTQEEASTVEAHILFCPNCCTHVDVETEHDGQKIDLVCVSCEFEFTVTVDRKKIAESNLHG